MKRGKRLKGKPWHEFMAEGKLAAVMGRACPYRPDSPMANAWLKGYRLKQAEIETNERLRKEEDREGITGTD